VGLEGKVKALEGKVKPVRRESQISLLGLLSPIKIFSVLASIFLEIFHLPFCLRSSYLPLTMQALFYRPQQ